MGCCQTDPKPRPQRSIKHANTYIPPDSLIVATLNYCGIMNSPFEFYCNDYEQELKDIGACFLSILPLYF